MVCIQDPVYHIPVICIWGATCKQFNAVLKKYFGLEVQDMLTQAGVFLQHEVEGKEVAFIGLSDTFAGTPDEYAILSHEALHCTFAMLKGRGISYSSKTEEAYTYFHSYLLSTLAEEMLKTEARLEKRRKKSDES